MNPLLSSVEQAIGEAVGQTVTILRRTGLAGGSTSHTERIETTAGPFVLKSHARPTTGFFRAEARGLEALSASGTSLAIPRVVACDLVAGAFLVLEFLPPTQRRPDFDEALGRGLALLHRTTAPRFGFEEDNYCGATPQRNGWCETWVDFYGARRLGFQLELAARAGLLAAAAAARVGRLVATIGDLIREPAEGPALVHGDLWSGNVHTDASGCPALLDPAVYYGHREAELGMMTLFGGFSERTFEAYDEAFALEPDWRERNPIYQLYHLMNHLNLFGASYRAPVMAVVDHFA